MCKGIPFIKMWWSWDSLILMGIPILVRNLHNELTPEMLQYSDNTWVSWSLKITVNPTVCLADFQVINKGPPPSKNSSSVCILNITGWQPGMLETMTLADNGMAKFAYKMIQWLCRTAAFKWFIHDSALTGTAVLHCFIQWRTVSPLLPTNQPTLRNMDIGSIA